MMYNIELYGVTAKGMIQFDSYKLYAPNKVAARHMVEADLSKSYSKTEIDNLIAIDITEEE